MRREDERRKRFFFFLSFLIKTLPAPRLDRVLSSYCKYDYSSQKRGFI